jgi:hypothetical protein
MHSQNVRSALLAYIGDALSTDDRETFDRRLFENEEFSRQVEEAEFELVEAYADRTLPAEERAIVGPWITRSPERHANAAITAALRARAIEASTIHIVKRRVVSVWLWAGVAACIALLATLPLLHRKQPAPDVVAQLNPAPGVQQKSTGEDTILLQAQHLRAAGEDAKIPVIYRLRADAPTRIQIIVPSAAPRDLYSIDLQPAARKTSSPVHWDGLPVTKKNNLSYVEFLLPAGSLPKGRYEGVLYSPSATYQLQFSVDYSGSSSLGR